MDFWVLKGDHACPRSPYSQLIMIHNNALTCSSSSLSTSSMMGPNTKMAANTQQRKNDKPHLYAVVLLLIADQTYKHGVQLQSEEVCRPGRRPADRCRRSRRSCAGFSHLRIKHAVQLADKTCQTTLASPRRAIPSTSPPRRALPLLTCNSQIPSQSRSKLIPEMRDRIHLRRK